MKLKLQIALMISLALLVPATLIGSLAIYKINSTAQADMEQYRSEEFSKLKLYLKHITDIAYGVVETQHQLTKDTTQENTMEEALIQLSKIRFDKGEGYFWVTDNKLPHPTMLMHAEKANLKGQVLSDAKHNVEKEKGRNIYQVRSELANANGDAYVEYTMKKPGSEEVINKISYSRLYKPLGWIISTGFYTDQIDAAVAKKKEELTGQIRNTILTIITIGVVILAIGLSVSFYFSTKLTDAIVLIKEKLKELAQGKQVDHVNSLRKDEVGDMTASLNSLVDGLKQYTSFAKEIGQGNLDLAFQPLSKEDILGTELVEMRDNLKSAETEKNMRDWANEGLAKLGEVLRRNNTNTKTLADEVLKELVKYLKVNQGALFIVSGQQKDSLELAAAYAYEKRKFINRTIDFGDGLAGQCVLERNTIHLREVPENYIRITSGLGQALPRTIILVPLMHNDTVYGVLEMASFRVFADHEITFIEKVAESIASTISTVQVNENTKTLLEQSQQMSEELKAQEEEMRQNMEELSATQEQMARQIEENRQMQDDLQVRENVFALTTILSEADIHGNILLVNDKLCEVSKYTRGELIGKPHNIFRHADMPKELFRIFWETIKSGNVFKGIVKNKAKDGSHYWVDATIVPVKNENGIVTKYIGARYHLTNENLAIELYNQQAIKMNVPLLHATTGAAQGKGYNNGHAHGKTELHLS